MGSDDICCMVVFSVMLGLMYLKKCDKLWPGPFKSSKNIESGQLCLEIESHVCVIVA